MSEPVAVPVGASRASVGTIMRATDARLALESADERARIEHGHRRLEQRKRTRPAAGG
jgi:hypothetical protein